MHVLASMWASKSQQGVKVIDFEIKLILKVKARYPLATAKNSSYQNGNQERCVPGVLVFTSYSYILNWGQQGSVAYLEVFVPFNYQ